MSDSAVADQLHSGSASLDAKNTLIPILLQYLVIFLLLEYSFRRGVHRDLRSISRIHYFLWVSLAIFGALFVLDKELGHPDHDPILVMRLLRPILLLTVFFFGIAANVYVWEKCEIPWQDMFRTGENKFGFRELAEVGSLLLCLFSATIFFLLRSDLPGPFTTLPAYLHPLLLYGGILMLLFSPLQQVFHESRFWFIGQIFRVFTPGCRPVGFMEFWLADQACSLVILFVDCEFLMCWYLVDGTVFDEKMGGRVSVINNTEVTIKVQFWQVSPLYSKTLKKGETWVQETGAVHFTVKVIVQESDDYLFGSDCGVLRGAERIDPASEWPLYEKIFHYSSTGWYFKGDNILSISGGPDLKSAHFAGKPLLIRKIPKRSQSVSDSCSSDLPSQLPTNGQTGKQKTSKSTKKGKEVKSCSLKVKNEDEENNLVRQTSSTSTSSNYSEQPSMDAIFENMKMTEEVSHIRIRKSD
ncbi:Oidioi.mRNA.OKI2018_I69.PAR.g12004.t1.cds [Oikopleura dioica]|uniref:Oidioi.mRNA.OKI2018_I69.PAR.g12004.t1.cds n=1 Tax=Oikopleura dioica TaxID=34765 RepID=A0ABN7S4J5_OIKDI|nr:Oidioi.mRNA.OKI2018_I69.PAR.g12004.t1.cds [Oikopleura dioica]